MPIPVLSVVMPVYNREKFIGLSIESILCQTFIDFELIIVNDGSTDRTKDIIIGYKDERIIVINNAINQGIVYSRNRGLSLAKGKYIGMFDSDDIAHPQKFEIQLLFLNKNPHIAMAGTWVRHIDQEDNILNSKWKLKASSKYIPAIQIFRNYFVQSSVIIKKEAIPEGGYSEGFDIVEDSKMWFDVSLNHQVANIHKFLVFYRIHSEGISNQQSDLHSISSRKLYRYIFKHLDIEISDQELEFHYMIKNKHKIKSISDLKGIEQWLLKIIKQNSIIKIYDERILKKVILNRWIKSCYKSKTLHIYMISIFLKSKLTRYIFS